MAQSKGITREKVKEAKARGATVLEMCRQFECSQQAIYYHLKKLAASSPTMPSVPDAMAGAIVQTDDATQKSSIATDETTPANG